MPRPTGPRAAQTHPTRSRAASVRPDPCAPSGGPAGPGGLGDPARLGGPAGPGGPRAEAGRDHPPLDLEGLDPRSALVFRALLRASRLHRQLLLRSAAAVGAHPGQAMILRILGTRDRLSQRELADLLLLGKPTVTTMLQRLERAGLVEREPDPDDQRVTRVRLTAEGRRLDARLRDAVVAAMARVLDPLEPADREALVRLLDLVSDRTAAVLEQDA